MNFRLSFLAVTLFIFSDCKAQISEGQELSKETTQLIDALFAEFDQLDSPGYAIGISKGDQTLYTNVYGAANLDYNLPITPQSSFSIASVSKQFTAACIALLILEDKISLESPVAQFVPELEKYNDTIRIKHLIYNTSGITDYPRLEREGGKSWVTFNYFDIDECITTSLAQDSLQFRPGDRWDYCNVNFMLLAKIVEKVSGTSFGQFALERLFKPLGMDDTMINDDITAIIKNRVTPYNLRTPDIIDGYKDYGIRLKGEGGYIQHNRNAPHYGGSGVVTTIDDLLLWSKNMVSKRFGGEEFYNLMHDTPKFNHDRSNQAFGLYIGDFNGREIVAWDGGDWGISSQLMRFTADGVAIVVLSNIGTGEAYRKVNAISDILIETGLIE